MSDKERKILNTLKDVACGRYSPQQGTDLILSDFAVESGAPAPQPDAERIHTIAEGLWEQFEEFHHTPIVDKAIGGWKRSVSYPDFGSIASERKFVELVEMVLSGELERAATPQVTPELFKRIERCLQVAAVAQADNAIGIEAENLIKELSGGYPQVTPERGRVCAECGNWEDDHARDALTKENPENWKWPKNACPIGHQPFSDTKVFRFAGNRQRAVEGTSEPASPSRCPQCGSTIRKRKLLPGMTLCPDDWHLQEEPRRAADILLESVDRAIDSAAEKMTRKEFKKAAKDFNEVLDHAAKEFEGTSEPASPTPEKCPKCGSHTRAVHLCRFRGPDGISEIHTDCEWCTDSWHSSASTPKGNK